MEIINILKHKFWLKKIQKLIYQHNGVWNIPDQNILKKIVLEYDGLGEDTFRRESIKEIKDVAWLNDLLMGRIEFKAVTSRSRYNNFINEKIREIENSVRFICED